MRFGVLGSLLICEEQKSVAVPAARQRILLATLLLRAGQPVSADMLAETVWDGEPPSTSVATLRSYVMRLRQTLGSVAGSRVRTGHHGYLIEAERDEVDVLRFIDLYASGGELTRSGAWQQASDTLTEALALWRGTPLADVPSQLLHRDEVPRLQQQRLQAIEWRIDADLRLGRHSQLVPDLYGLAKEHPLRERFHAQLMLALYRCGRQAEALDAYRAARTTLITELGVEPGAELQQIHHQLLSSDPELTPASAPETVAVPHRPGPDRPPVPHQLPAAIRYFAGRQPELVALTELLDQLPGPAGTVAIFAVAGMAGVGKTTLAVSWAHKVADRFPDGQLYVNLRGYSPSSIPTSPATAIRGFLDALGTPAHRIPSDLDAQSALYRSLLAGRRMLIVLDNARDAEQVRPLLPGASGCLVLVTSRDQLIGLVAADGARVLTLNLFTHAEAHDLLGRRLGQHRTTSQPEAADQIVSACAGLPLALAIVAAQAETQPGFPLAALAAELGESRYKLPHLNGGDAATDLRATFNWSYETLPPDVARLFRLLALHPGPDISVPAAASLAGLSCGETRDLLSHLTRANLINEHCRGRYALHDLLRAYGAERAQRDDSAAGRHAAIRGMLDHYLYTAYAATLLLYPHRDAISLPDNRDVRPERLASRDEAMRWFNAECPVLLAAVHSAATTGFPAHAWQLAWSLATYLDRQGHWRELESTQHVALEAARRLDDPEGEGEAYLHLARAVLLLGNRAAAKSHYRRALKVFTLAPNRAGQARAHRGLGIVSGRQGNRCEALRHAELALRLYREIGHESGQATALNNVGWCQVQLGDHRQALVHCRNAFELFRKIGDRDGQAGTLDSLGSALHQLGNHADAIDCYRRALGLWREIGDRYSQAVVLSHLGETHGAAGNRRAARDSWQQAALILDELGHSDGARARQELERC
jgi:DNA-binding SARP family transcriptional activator/Tfp pilus assembly protein PilF